MFKQLIFIGVLCVLGTFSLPPGHCRTDSDCPSPQICLSRRCGSCTTKAQSAAVNPATPICQGGTCVACATDADCSTAADDQAHTTYCVGNVCSVKSCANDNDCTSPLDPYCTNAGTCGGCPTTAFCQKKFRKTYRFCDSSTGDCFAT
jgi:hypothetical protein